MRTLLSLVIIISAGSSAIAKDGAKSKTATEAEIRQVLAGSADLKSARNGFEYRPGSPIGFKISDGKICTLSKGQLDCLDVYSDGKRLEVIDKKGNRDFLN